MRWLELLISCTLSLCSLLLSTQAQAANFVVKQQHYGWLKGGQSITQYHLISPQMEVSVINYGGIITSVKVPDRNGVMADVVLGYDNLVDYETKNRYFGAIVGRFANRLESGRAKIAGSIFELEKNRPPHHLHGGSKGFDKVVWQATSQVSDNNASLILKYQSPDGEAGYPGNLDVTVTYRIDQQQQLSVEYQASTDKPTIFNPTQHSYFNLSGDQASNIYDHSLQINSGQYLTLSKDSIPLGFVASVKDTIFDFQAAKPLAQVLANRHSELINSKGLDHFWLNKESRGELTEFAQLYHPTSGRKLTVYSTEVGGQIYSANYLSSSVIGKDKQPYQKHAGVCIETGQYPNSPNNGFPDVLIRPNEPYYSNTIFAFSLGSAP